MQQSITFQCNYPVTMRTLDMMLPSESVKILVLSLLNINFLSNVAGLYSPETNLGKCFEGTSEGYILLFDRSFVDCVRECKRRPRCQALRYDRRVLICMLYPTNKIPKRDISGCHQASRGEVINQYVRWDNFVLYQLSAPRKYVIVF